MYTGTRCLPAIKIFAVLLPLITGLAVLGLRFRENITTDFAKFNLLKDIAHNTSYVLTFLR